MKIKLLLSFLFSSFIAIHSSYISPNERLAIVSIKDNNKASINGIAAHCYCGKDPVLVMFLYGKLHVYCQDHLPEFDRIKRITPENLSEILRRES